MAMSQTDIDRVKAAFDAVKFDMGRRMLSAARGAASGVAELDTNTLVPANRLGTGTSSDTSILYGDRVWRAAPSGGGGATLDTVIAGTILRCPWNGTAWTYGGTALSARPSARTDIFFDLTGAPVATADPSWMIDGDVRTDVP